MKPFRKKLALAIDGGGLRGIIVARALMSIEQELGAPLHKSATLLAGSSTGSIIAASIASGLTAEEILKLYKSLGGKIFKKSWRTTAPLSLIARYRYERAALAAAMKQYVGDRKMGELWLGKKKTDLMITTFDLIENRTRFIKPWKAEYRDWEIVQAVLCSSAAPTYFPVVDGQYTDGGVGTFNNPCALTAYEAKYCLGWKAEDTTLISIGTGRNPRTLKKGQPEKWHAWDWLNPLLDAFMDSSNDQQVNIVDKFYPGIDFRRFQIDLETPIAIDDPNCLDLLEDYGAKLGEMILKDAIDTKAQGIKTTKARTIKPIASVSKDQHSIAE